MTVTPVDYSNCRFCAEVSRINGEDPIGTAGTADHWLIFERPQPWSAQMYQDDPVMKPLIKRLKQLIFRHGVLVRPVLIAPDREYSSPETTRVFYYYRPQRLFTQYTKREFMIPTLDFLDFAEALLKSLVKKANRLEHFLPLEQDTQSIREIMVCTHGNIDAACARFGFPIYQQLRTEYAARSDGQLRVWRCSHFGGHQFAPTLIDLPVGHYWGHLEPQLLDALVYRRGEVEKLRSHFRGWAGLTKFEQIAERELWMQQGWNWLSLPRAGHTRRKGLQGVKKYLYRCLRVLPSKRVQLFLDQWTKNAVWAEVQIEVQQPQALKPQVYKMRVEQCGAVNTALKSPQPGKTIEFQSVPQYQATGWKNARP